MIQCNTIWKCLTCAQQLTDCELSIEQCVNFTTLYVVHVLLIVHFLIGLHGSEVGGSRVG